jgi:hypothetical protein
VDIAHGGVGLYDPLSVKFQYILENAVRGRMRRPEVEGGGGLAD